MPCFARARTAPAAALLLACLLPAAAAAQQPVLRSGAAEITLNGRVHTQWNTTSLDDQPTSAWLLRRVRLEARVAVNDWIGGKIQPDFAGDRVSLKDAYLSLRPADGVEILAGQAHRPFSILTRYSSLRMGPVEKGLEIRGVPGWDEQNLLSDLGYANRDIGVQLLLTPDSVPLGLFGEVALLDGPLGGEVVGRHTYQLVTRAGIAPREHLSLSAAWSRRHFLRPDPSSDPAAETSLQGGDALLASLAWDPPAGPYIIAEATTGDFDPAADARFDAVHFWTGWRFPLAARVTMVEPIARVSHGSVTDRAVADGTLLTGGVNLYFGTLNRLMLDVERWNAGSVGPDATSVKAMFQLAF